MNKTPHELADEVVKWSGQYSRLSEVYAEYQRKEAEFFNKNREDYKSDNAVKKAWEVTKDGVDMTVTKTKIKSLEKKISANKTMLRVLESEGYNNY